MSFSLVVGDGEWLPLHHFFFFFFPSSFLFPLLVKLSLSQPISFLIFALPILSVILLETRSEQAAVWCLTAGQGQSTTIGIRGFLIVFTSKKAFLTILVPPHPVLSGSFLSSFQLYHQFYPWCMLKFDTKFNTSSKSEFCQNCQEAEIMRMNLIL